MTKPKKKMTPVATQLRSEQHEAALDEYEKGIRLLQQKDYQKAIPRFEAVLAGFPGEAALCDRARLYLRIAKGESAARRPVRSTRDPADSFEVGIYLLNDGDFKEAVRHLERAAEHAPTDGGIQIALASARLHGGDVDGCLKALARAIEIEPKAKYKIRNLSDFEPLDDSPEYEALIADD